MGHRVDTKTRRGKKRSDVTQRMNRSLETVRKYITLSEILESNITFKFTKEETK